MTFIPFPTGTVEVLLNAQLLGIPAQNTLGFHLETGDPATITDMTDLANAIKTYFTAHFRGSFCGGYLLVDITVNDLTSESGLTFTLPCGIYGTASGTGVPNQVAMTVSFLSGIRGRSYRGRNYVMGLPNTDLLNETHWDSTNATDIASRYQDMATACLAVNWQHVILSRFLDRSLRDEGHVQNVLEYRGNTGITTQRRRLT